MARTVGLIAAVLLVWASVGATAGAHQPELVAETVATGLDVPWAIARAPDGRLFLTERPGRIRVIRDGNLEPRPVLTLSDVVAEGEGGLLGLALHPGFPRPPFLYLYYTYERPGLTFFNRVVRAVERGGSVTVDRIILDRIPGWLYHNAGRILFGPDGRLYIGTGYAGFPEYAQDPRSLAGKILRVNADGTVPADNPFAGSPVYSLGHRNVQGLVWHPLTRRLYATEHGPTGERGLCCRDEINLIEAGKNYGWPLVAGRAGDPRFTDPVLDSGVVEAWAPSGATFVTAGPWRNALLFAALRGRHLHRVLFGADGRSVVAENLLLRWQFGRLRDVMEAPDGSLYLLTSNRDGRGLPVAGDDRILRLLPGAQGGP